jgi:predicted RecA/RadA family phage recombinase
MAEQIKLACELSQTESLPFSGLPTGGLEKGEVTNIYGNIWGFAFSDASDDSDNVNYAPSVLLITKAAVCIGAKASGAIAQGAKLYWDNSGKVMTTTVGSNPYFGIARKAALSADTEVEFIFDRTGDL